MQEKEWLEILEQDHEMVTRLAFADWLEEQERSKESLAWRNMVEQGKYPATVLHVVWEESRSGWLAPHENNKPGSACDYGRSIRDKYGNDAFCRIGSQEHYTEIQRIEGKGRPIPNGHVASTFEVRLQAELAYVRAWIALEGKEESV